MNEEQEFIVKIIPKAVVSDKITTSNHLKEKSKTKFKNKSITWGNHSHELCIKIFEHILKTKDQRLNDTQIITLALEEYCKNYKL
ncbi:hypothetical protein [Empedobacter sp.]|uniref:hypothetical protein n=1 Tax=Empedobacter sp. TaxID=1927715 RepID=UPI0028AE59E6|nr:hypothetical protein [Empedobacter sp.]